MTEKFNDAFRAWRDPRSLHPVVRRRFAIHKALGNWMVRMADGKEKHGRMLCLCTRQCDAQYIATLLNRQHSKPPNDRAERQPNETTSK